MTHFRKQTALALRDKGFFSQAILTIILLLAGLVGLLIGGTPVAAGAGLPQRQAAIQAALGYLHSQQQSDGAIGGLGNSCETAWVIAVAGEDPTGGAWKPQDSSLWDACLRDVPTYLALRDPGRMAKVLRAAVAVGADPRAVAGLDLIAELEAGYDAQSGLYHPFSLYRHNLVVLALHEAGRPLPSQVAPTLLAQQRADGSWGWPIDPTPGDGDPATGDPDTTGLTLQTLAAAGVGPNHPAMVAGVAYLLANQHDDAGWGQEDISDSNATAWGIAGLLAAGWDPQSPRFVRQGSDPLTRLLAFQDAEGAFWWRASTAGSRMRATLDALPVLSQAFPGDVSTPLASYLPLMLSLNP